MLPRPQTKRVSTPGRGTYHDGRTLARGFQDGNLLWRSFGFQREYVEQWHAPWAWLCTLTWGMCRMFTG